ncbi:MAG: gamma-glutamyl-gamma-aminobutyrate hydrolase family protein [Desulfomonilaceae bacterium]
MMRRRFIGGPGRRAFVVLVLCLAVVVVLLYIFTREHKLNGLLVDLELGWPDSSRHSALREVLTHRLQAEVPSLRNTCITIRYVHFSDLTSNDLIGGDVDFVILSPQSTPWYKYSGEAGAKLEAAKALVKDLVLKKDVPVLGICGGLQFLAMAFGASVDFIDSNLVGAFPDVYPKDACVERGEAVLHILRRDDPIFAGLAENSDKLTVMESHYEEVKAIPKGFINLATSKTSPVQLIRFPEKPVYGAAFHPERCPEIGNGAESSVCDGRKILANFLRMASHK